jgi:hypothetical protein
VDGGLERKTTTETYVSCPPKSAIRNPQSAIWELVGERSVLERSVTGRTRGLNGSEDAGISSEKTGENPVRRKPKGS